MPVTQTIQNFVSKVIKQKTHKAFSGNAPNVRRNKRRNSECYGLRSARGKRSGFFALEYPMQKIEEELRYAISTLHC